MENRTQNWLQDLIVAAVCEKSPVSFKNLDAKGTKRVVEASAAAGLWPVVTYAWPSFSNFNVTVYR